MENSLKKDLEIYKLKEKKGDFEEEKPTKLMFYDIKTGKLNTFVVSGMGEKELLSLSEKNPQYDFALTHKSLNVTAEFYLVISAGNKLFSDTIYDPDNNYKGLEDHRNDAWWHLNKHLFMGDSNKNVEISKDKSFSPNGALVIRKEDTYFLRK